MKWFRVSLVLLWAVFILGAMLVNCKAWADVIGADIGSVHAHPGMNGVNPGVYVMLDNGLSGGTYYNSERRMTVWAGYTWSPAGVTGPFAVTVGAATGYSRAKVVPIVVPSVRIGLSEDTSIRVSLAAVPKNPALHISLERRF